MEYLEYRDDVDLEVFLHCLTACKFTFTTLAGGCVTSAFGQLLMSKPTGGRGLGDGIIQKADATPAFTGFLARIAGTGLVNVIRQTVEAVCSIV